MIALIIALVLLAVLVAGSIESNLREAFRGDWMQFDEQQAGIAAMQGLMSKEYLDNPDSLVSHAIHYAHALVEKYKKEV